ncbi:Membrane proteinase PrsW, cleaves anti-sigma factor RsiW, M82 family [Paenibacillus catalpae]|uniref:Protease PrsW n=1 Tax=Paenibacillus catalpae TaxID=1045775 RepID=A0A1I2FFS3_9BACL|nr:glutamic-type intramembrane protease PrsW [Paenibacillus catalpae]SFF04252.1 Membrane proteinase PrsW, cleaves anti-sigma factor RsiW, M82 family [Paenibacillus catalpae]
MLLFSVLTAAVAPGVSLLTYLYLKDRYDAEPIHMVVRMFLLGVLIVVPIVVIQRGLQLWFGDNQPVLFSFVESAGIEEFVKWFVLYHMIYNHTEFDEPYDGIVYAASISLGFATLENVLYAIYSPSTFGTLLMRALLPVSGHALFGVMMGYYVGKAKFATASKRNVYLTISLCLPLLLHGTYDYIMISFKTNWIFVIIPFMVALWVWGLRKMNNANSRSPFRFISREDEIKL